MRVRQIGSFPRGEIQKTIQHKKPPPTVEEILHHDV